MNRKLLGFGLILFGILFFCIGSLIPFYCTVMRVLTQYLILLSLGILFLIIGVVLSLKETRKTIGLVSFFTSLLTTCYFIIWIWSLFNEWSSSINNSWLTPVYIGIFSIVTGILANKKVEKFDKFGLAGLIITILSSLITFAYVLFVFFTAPPI